MKKLLVISSLPPAAFACCRRYPPDGWPLSNPVYRQSGPALLDAQATLGEQEHSTHSRHRRPLLSIGNVTIKNGIEYEVEASGTVTLEDGFKVKEGAKFAVYPACL